MSQIEELDFSSPKIVLSVGKQKSGKTNMTKHLIIKNSIKKKIFNFRIVFTGSSYSDEYNYLPKKFIIDGWNDDIFNNYIKKLKKRVDKVGEKQFPANFMIIDDCLGLIQRKGFIRNLYSCHRHLNMTIFLNSQYYYDVDTVMRELIHYAILFNTKSFRSLKAYFEQFGMLFEKFEQFKEYFFNCTKEKYSAMLYVADEDDINKNYLSIKSPDVSKLDIKLKY